MSALEHVLRVVTLGPPMPREAAELHHECRNCGLNVEPMVDRCPICGGGIAAYRID